MAVPVRGMATHSLEAMEAMEAMEVTEVMGGNGRERIRSISSTSAPEESLKLNHRKLHQVQFLRHGSCIWLKVAGVRSIENGCQLSVWRLHNI